MLFTRKKSNNPHCDLFNDKSQDTTTQSLNITLNEFLDSSEFQFQTSSWFKYGEIWNTECFHIAIKRSTAFSLQNLLRLPVNATSLHLKTQIQQLRADAGLCFHWFPTKAVTTQAKVLMTDWKHQVFQAFEDANNKIQTGSQRGLNRAGVVCEQHETRHRWVL